MSAGPLDAENPGGGIFPKLDGVSEGRAEQPRRCLGLPKSCRGSPQWRGDGCALRCEVWGPSASSECSSQLGAPSCPPPEQHVS